MFTNVSYLNEYDVKEGGKVVVKKVNLLPEHVQHIEHRYTKLEDKADVEYINIELGGSENILNYYHDLVGQESRMVHDIAYLGNEEQKFDISMIMSHGGKKSFSDIHTLGALSGNSKKSNHAASAGQIDHNKLFYIMSRGFSEVEAKHIIVESMIRPIIDRIGDETIEEAALAAVRNKI